MSDATERLLPWLKFTVPLILSGLGLYVGLIISPMDKTLDNHSKIIPSLVSHVTSSQEMMKHLNSRINEVKTTADSCVSEPDFFRVIDLLRQDIRELRNGSPKQ